MKQLVKQLRLPIAAKDTLLKELEDWEKKGNDKGYNRKSFLFSSKEYNHVWIKSLFVFLFTYFFTVSFIVELFFKFQLPSVKYKNSRRIWMKK